MRIKWALSSSPDYVSNHMGHHILPPTHMTQSSQTILCSSFPYLCTYSFLSQNDLSLLTCCLCPAHFLLANTYCSSFPFLPCFTILRETQNWYYLFKTKQILPLPGKPSIASLGGGKRYSPLSTHRAFLEL